MNLLGKVSRRATSIPAGPHDVPTHVSESIRTKSTYLGTLIWHYESAGLLDASGARRAIEALAEKGLDSSILQRTYRYFKVRGITIPWLDEDFQRQVRKQYLPDLLRSTRTAKGGR